MNSITKLQDKCFNGEHVLITICSEDCGDFEKVVRWCKLCGGIVVDMDFDGHTNAGYYQKMKFPYVTNPLFNENKSRYPNI